MTRITGYIFLAIGAVLGLPGNLAILIGLWFLGAFDAPPPVRPVSRGRELAEQRWRMQ